ncbi:QsdR family transcriptional regulator [Nocardia alba]|uniref:AcrR family transcriptional regulator n=1 Tax=Nocardia alba TaxID=225051 RepID=A0A4R1FPR6_9NOCA|nr:QsdR family transcriptional regulator [Nocardia alba]TCJ96603.1 AcrR family transcriptional regulator [Nocardia alba]
MTSGERQSPAPEVAATDTPAKPVREAVIDLAHRWFLEGRRIDMQQLARACGIGRATLYRWWGSREVVIGEVVWRIIAEAIDRVEARDARVPGDPARRFVRNFGTLADTVRTFEPLTRFVAEDPEYGLRVLTSGYTVVQGRMIDWAASRLAEIPDLDPRIEVRDLAYAIVRVGEAFVWSDIITGDPPQSGKATAMVSLLVSAATGTR